jgi:hypothetical protein
VASYGNERWRGRSAASRAGGVEARAGSGTNVSIVAAMMPVVGAQRSRNFGLGAPSTPTARAGVTAARTPSSTLAPMDCSMLERSAPPAAAHHSQSRAPIQIGALTRIGVLGRELTMSNLSAVLHAVRFAIRIR